MPPFSSMVTPKAGRTGARARFGNVLAQRIASSVAQPLSTHASRRHAGALDARHIADVRRDGSDVARVLAVRPQPGEGQIRLRRYPYVQNINFDRLARAPIKLVRHRNQRAYRPRTRVPQRRYHARRPARFRLLADAVPGRRDRWRELLGWRLFRQSDNHPADPRMYFQGHDPRSDQPDRASRNTPLRARHSKSSQRSFIQFRSVERTADDRNVAAGRQSRQLRGRALGEHAHPSYHRATRWSLSAIPPSSTPNGSFCACCATRDAVGRGISSRRTERV